jgi:hypothetical protein
MAIRIGGGLRVQVAMGGIMSHRDESHEGGSLKFSC